MVLPLVPVMLTLERVPGGVDVGGLGVVDVHHAADAEHGLEPVLDRREGLQAGADDLVADARGLGGQGGGHGVVDVVLAAECQVLQEDLGLVALVADDDAVVAQEGALGNLFLLGEGEHLGLDDDLAELLDRDGVVGVEDEAVLGAEVACDAELGLGVFLEAVVVTVQVVRRDVGDDGDVRTEVIGVVQLETADFQDIVGEGAGGWPAEAGDRWRSRPRRWRYRA